MRWKKKKKYARTQLNEKNQFLSAMEMKLLQSFKQEAKIAVYYFQYTYKRCLCIFVDSTKMIPAYTIKRLGKSLIDFKWKNFI